MSDEYQFTENDLQNHIRGLGTPAPTHLIEKVMDKVKELEAEGKTLKKEELDEIFNRKPQREAENDDLER